MTVSKDYNKHVYKGNGLTVDWPYDFDLPITAAGTPDTSLIHVFRTNLRGEVTEVTAFSVDAKTGTLTYPTSGSPLETGEKLTILRLLDVRQQFFDPNNQANLYPETLEDNTDRLVMMVQQLAETTNRAVCAPIDDSYSPDELTEQVIETYKRYPEILAAHAETLHARDLTTAARAQTNEYKDIALAAASSANTAKEDAIEAKDLTLAAAQVTAWNSGTTYNFPTLVARPNGHTYRCIGNGVIGEPVPEDSAQWVAITSFVSIDTDDSLWVDGLGFGDSSEFDVFLDGKTF